MQVAALVLVWVWVLYTHTCASLSREDQNSASYGQDRIIYLVLTSALFVANGTRGSLYRRNCEGVSFLFFFYREQKTIKFRATVRPLPPTISMAPVVLSTDDPVHRSKRCYYYYYKCLPQQRLPGYE